MRHVSRIPSDWRYAFVSKLTPTGIYVRPVSVNAYTWISIALNTRQKHRFLLATPDLWE